MFRSRPARTCGGKEQLCGVARVYTARSEDALLGRMGSIYLKYCDPVVHKTIPSVNIRAHLSGELVTVCAIR